MRVLLINPFYPMTEMPSPPLGLAYVAGAFCKAGAEVKVLDLVVEAYSREIMTDLLDTFQPDLVGLTAVTMNYNGACDLLKVIKELQPDLLTVMGGPHVTFNAREELLTHPELDMVVTGEGEATIAELTRALDSGSKLNDVAGLVYREGSEIRFNKPRPTGLDLSQAPMPARHLLPMRRYKALGLAVSMITSRGCPFQCIFCVGRKMSGAKVRYRDPISVVDEMEQLASLGISQINIADDLFTAKKKHCHAICDEIIRRGLKVPWTAFSRANTINAELLDHLKQAGCIHLSFGFESANDDILETVQKRITPDQMINAARLCTEAGITSQASFISGLPGETPETMEQTSAFAQQIDRLGMAVGFHILAPFPGTLVRDEADKLGLRILSNDWSRYTANEAIIETDGANAELLERDSNGMQALLDEQLAATTLRIEDGTATDEEKSGMRRLHKMNVFYQMMMADTLKHVSESDEPDVDHLMDVLDEQSPLDSQLLREFLDEGLEDGSILHTHELSGENWAWG